MPKYICIHGHFYQPPRENPWLEVLEVQDSAAPFHDWNQRVAAECYAPNCAARVLGEWGTIDRIVNNYQRISFNFGPTLLSWLEKAEPEVHACLLEADRRSLERWGHGNALAQVYNHVIMPLASERDRLTQIRWGKADFRRRFGRDPEGMWLAETAVDTRTLELMAAEGICFTILEPGQIAAVRPGPDRPWQKTDGGGVDPKRPYLVRLPGGQSIAIIVYDGPASRAVAFEGLLRDGAAFARRIQGLADPGRDEAQLVTLATDGESYGHHHRFGEMALAFALDVLDDDPEVELINPAAFLERFPPTWEARVADNTSWSCAHGVERWRSDCGCSVNPASGWNQKWRTPLRNGLDRLNEHLAELFAERGAALLADPWAARDAYVELLDVDNLDARRAFLKRHQAHDLNHDERVEAAKLLEMQRFAMFMFTSCAWFFDDIGGLEAVQNLRYAARAIQLAAELGRQGLEEELVTTLGKAQSNQPGLGSGADIWRRKVAPARVGTRRVAAHAAISGVMGDQPPPERLYCYDLAVDGHRHLSHLGLDLSLGRMTITHRRLGESKPVIYAALHASGHDFRAWVMHSPNGFDLGELEREVTALLRSLDLPAMVRVLDARLGDRPYSLGDLFLEGRRDLALTMLESRLGGDRTLAKNVFEANREVMGFLREINVPVPPLLTALAQAVLGDELVSGLKLEAGSDLPGRLGEIALAAKSLELDLSGDRLARAAQGRLERILDDLAQEPGDAAQAAQAGEVLDLAEALGQALDLWGAQNRYYRLLTSLGKKKLPLPLVQLGARLNFDL